MMPELSLVETPEPEVGDVLGAYRLEAVAGEGGMGRVFRAVHTKLERVVALKLLRRKYAQRPDAIARFFHEARAVNVIKHPNIVEITDFVEAPPGGDSFYIMEWLEGTDLATLLEDQGTLTVEEVVNYGRQIASALAAVHRAGFVHRDIKPDNVFIIEREGRKVVKILDFGVALLLGTDDDAVVGTPVYFSPECAAGRTCDARSDIYSLGVMLYELLSGCPPFLGDTLIEYVNKHMNERPRPVEDAVQHAIPPPLGDAVNRCLEKKPDSRFQSMEELEQLLASLEKKPEPAAVPAKGRAGLMAVAAIAVLAAVIAIVALARKKPTETIKVVTVPSQPVQVVAPPVDDGKTAVAVASWPSGAEVYKEGALVGTTPCTLRLAKGAQSLELRLTGYKSAARDVDPDKEASLMVQLEKVGAGKKPATGGGGSSHRSGGGKVSKDGTINPFE